MKRIDLNFDGYWRHINCGSVPAKSGIYCVYTGIHNVAEKNVTLKKLIYIGESEDGKGRISNHERLKDWEKELNYGETLIYSFAEVLSTDRVHAEASLIYKHKPILNTEYKSAYPYNETQITTAGSNSHLESSFVIRESLKSMWT